MLRECSILAVQMQQHLRCGLKVLLLPMHDTQPETAVQLWTSEGKGWARASGSKLNCRTEGLRDLYVDALLQGRHQQLSDFDDHLNDIAK